MDQTTALSTLVDFIQARTGVPARVAGMEDERPVPVVIAEDWDTNDLSWENSAYAGTAVDPEDGIEKRWYRFYYSMRVALLIKHHDNVQGHRLLDSLKRELAMVREDPATFHPHVNEFRIAGSGGIDHQFLESKETELSQAVVIDSFFEVKDSSYDTLQDVIDNFTINSP